MSRAPVPSTSANPSATPVAGTVLAPAALAPHIPNNTPPHITNNTAMMDKYRAVPRAKQPVAEDEIRVSMLGRIPRYVTYAARLLRERGKDRVTIKATGNAIPGAITFAEVLKRRFENLHQLNTIGVSKTVDTFEPIEIGLDQVTYERDVPFIEITLTTDPSNVDKNAPGYQEPVDQSLVRPLLESTEPGAERGRGSRYRGRPRGRSMRGGFGRGGRGGMRYSMGVNQDLPPHGRQGDIDGQVNLAGAPMGMVPSYRGGSEMMGGYRGRGSGGMRGGYRGSGRYRGSPMRRGGDPFRNSAAGVQ